MTEIAWTVARLREPGRRSMLDLSEMVLRCRRALVLTVSRTSKMYSSLEHFARSGPSAIDELLRNRLNRVPDAVRTTGSAISFADYSHSVPNSAFPGDTVTDDQASPRPPRDPQGPRTSSIRTANFDIGPIPMEQTLTKVERAARTLVRIGVHGAVAAGTSAEMPRTQRVGRRRRKRHANRPWGTLKTGQRGHPKTGDRR